MGPSDTTSLDLPPTAEDLTVNVEPLTVLEKRVIYQNSLPLTQVLVWWTHLHLDHTREYLPNLLKQFPRATQLL